MPTSLDTLAGLSEALETEFEHVIQWCTEQPESTLSTGPEGAWTALEHLDHLILSTKPLNMALRLPKTLLGLRFSKAKQASLSYDEVVDKYTQCLAAGGKASGPYLPADSMSLAVPTLSRAFTHEGKRLLEVLNHWNDAQVDTYRLPHPLIGNLTVREMLYFTLYHIRHHLATLKQRCA